MRRTCHRSKRNSQQMSRSLQACHLGPVPRRWPPPEGHKKVWKLRIYIYIIYIYIIYRYTLLRGGPPPGPLPLGPSAGGPRPLCGPRPLRGAMGLPCASLQVDDSYARDPIIPDSLGIQRVTPLFELLYLYKYEGAWNYLGQGIEEVCVPTPNGTDVGLLLEGRSRTMCQGHSAVDKGNLKSLK